MQGLTRELALVNVAIDSKLRGCDVVAVRVDAKRLSAHAEGAPSMYWERAVRRGVAGTHDQLFYSLPCSCARSFGLSVSLCSRFGFPVGKKPPDCRFHSSA
jgi:hypothetical protein